MVTESKQRQDGRSGDGVVFDYKEYLHVEKATKYMDNDLEIVWMELIDCSDC